MITLAPITERIKKIDLTEDMGGGLINDPAAAARNRQNIERMRKREGNPYKRHLEFPAELPRPQHKVITQQVKEIKQEVKENMAVETKPVVPTVPEKSKAQILWRDSAKIAWFMVFEAINK